MRRTHLLWLLLILLIALGLGLLLLGSKSLWLDEAHSALLAEQSLARLWQRGGQRPETHPPLHSFILHAWARVAGTGETAVRLPSVLFSVLNVALIYWLGCRLSDRRVALLAAALLAVSPLSVWYAQEARMYIFMATAALLLALSLTWDSWWAILPLTAASTYGLYMDYTYPPLWVAVSGVWLWAWWRGARSRRHLAVWAISAVLAWITYLPWYANFVAILELMSDIFLFEQVRLLFNLPFFGPGFYLVGLLALGAAAFVGAELLWRALQHARWRRWIVVLTVGGFVALLVLFVVPRLFAFKRVLLVGWPLVVLFVAWLLIHSARPRVWQALLGLSLAASLFTITAVPKDDWRGVVHYLRDNVPATAVVWVEPHWNREPLRYYGAPQQPGFGELSKLQQLAAGDVWYVAERFPGQPVPGYRAEAWLDANLELVEAIPFYRLELRRYRAPVP